MLYLPNPMGEVLASAYWGKGTFVSPRQAAGSTRTCASSIVSTCPYGPGAGD